MTVGAIEANFLSVVTVASPGDRVAVMMPNYMQIWGVAKNRGLDVSTFDLLAEDGWALDLEGLEAAVVADTRLIAVCNPNNPTGRVLSADEMDAVVRQAERAGAWILADEVYAGAERLGGDTTPSFWGRHDKVLAVGSMSKAYGMPGLRLGWVVAPKETVDEIWARHEYVTLAATMLSNQAGGDRPVARRCGRRSWSAREATSVAASRSSSSGWPRTRVSSTSIRRTPRRSPSCATTST